MCADYREDFFLGYSHKQFLLFFVCEDPWNYLRNYEIPNEIVLRSGLKGLKRKAEDVETLVVGDIFSWLEIREERFYVISKKLENLAKIKDFFLPIPYLRGRIKKSEIIIYRDSLNFHPLYYTRLPDGFILSPRKEWIMKLGYEPESITRTHKIIVEKNSIEITAKQVLNHDLDWSDAVEHFIKNIERAYKLLKAEFNELYFIPTGEPEDLIIMDLLDDIIVIWPIREGLPMKKSFLQCDISASEQIKMKIIEKIEAQDQAALFHGLLCEICLNRTRTDQTDSYVILNGYSYHKHENSNSSYEENWYQSLQNLFKAVWPEVTIPILLSQDNTLLLKKSYVTIKEIMDRLKINSKLVINYQKLFHNLVNSI